MKTILTNFGASALISFLITLPFMVMEVVNRREFEEGFPYNLFLVLGLNLLVICLILLPLARSAWQSRKATESPLPAQGQSPLANPRWAALTGVLIFGFPFLLMGLDALGLIPLQRLVNGPNPGQPYPPGQVIVLVSFAFPAAAGLVAGNPVAQTLRSKGSLFAHPLNLLLVALIVSLIAYGVVSLLIDQWPCFIGVPNCD